MIEGFGKLLYAQSVLCLIEQSFLFDSSLSLQASVVIDGIVKLQHIKLVFTVCSELDNHSGIGDKSVAEFVIEQAQQNS